MWRLGCKGRTQYQLGNLWEYISLGYPSYFSLVWCTIGDGSTKRDKKQQKGSWMVAWYLCYVPPKFKD